MKLAVKVPLVLGVVAAAALVIWDRVYRVDEWQPPRWGGQIADPESKYPAVQLWGAVPRGWSVKDPSNLVLRAESGGITWQGKDIREELIASYIDGLIDSQRAEGILIVFTREAKFQEVVAVLDKLRLTKAKWITIYNET